MKKLLGVLFAICFAFLPIVTNAAEKVASTIKLEDYSTTGLKEVLKEEKMTEKFKSYTETDDQINIYLFRGNGCAYCRSFLTFLNSITDEYGKKFKLVSFESWYDSNNAELLETVSEFMENPAQGVPYIIIGDKVFPGYAAQYDEDIKSAIDTLYSSEDRYDVFEAYNKHLDELDKVEFMANNRIIIWVGAFVLVSTICMILFVNHSNKKLLNALTTKSENTKIVEKVKPIENVVEKKTATKKKVIKK